MDTKTLSFTVALVGTALALLIVIFAVYRKERGLSIYAAGFLAAVVGFLLFIAQALLPRSMGNILANMLILFFQLSLAWGLRVRSRLGSGWPRRFWMYLLVWLIALVVLTTVFESFTLRAILFSAFIILAALEFLIAFTRIQPAISKIVYRAVWCITLSFSLLHAVRIVLLMAYSSVQTRLTDNTFVSIYTFTFTSFFAILWAGLILLIDVADLFEQLGHKNKALELMATSDKLTGLKNRHSLDARLDSEIERSLRYSEPLSIILFDIDHFKRVNDTWGHPAGDEVLKQMARIASTRLRGPDDLYRWGGEEFLIVAPHTDLQGSLALAEKLRAAIEADTFPLVGPLTSSFGVAEFQPAEDRDAWFKRVDQALYRAKNTGRNKVVGFGEQESMPVASVRIDWRSEWSSGNRVIDDGHRALLELFNSLLDISLSETDREKWMPGMEALLEHVVAHFADEEKILSELGYPDLVSHSALHSDLVQKSLALAARVKTGAGSVTELFDFLVNQIVVGHMVNADSFFFEYTRAQ
ncbi:MAG: hypothetical protein A2Y38_05720 [Spirochaetes bacterium GWB1_59_5]|nr:MAG: hypothetical protein A2Y38_05720 [Spirochaetes bacterium GWB1_59_5]